MNEPVQPSPAASRPRAVRRFQAALTGGDKRAIAAASGRLAYWNRMVPQFTDRGAAAIAWRREAGISGYANRSARRRGLV